MTITSLRALRVACVTLLLSLAGLLTPAGPALADTLPPPGTIHLAMRLVADTTAPRPGGSMTLALETRPQAGWHGYWRNPGDAGFPTKFEWTLPKGASVGDVQWPVPTTLLVAGLMNYVYDRPYAPLVTLTVPQGMAPGTPLPIRVRADYLVCTTSLCVPESQTLSIDLVAGNGAPGPAAAEVAAWRRALPRLLDSAATMDVQGPIARIAIPYPAGAALAEPYLFPVTTGGLDYAAPQTVVRDGDRLIVTTKPATGVTKAMPLDAVLRIGPAAGLAIHAVPGTVAATSGDAPWWTSALIAFAGAVLGGLILNVMPCVFPILSIKALSLARSGENQAAARAEGLAYTAGVVLVCVGLGAVILALRAGGSAVGWAFQLQDPRVIVLLLVLCVAIALNLSGGFELPTPRFAGRSGAGGAFATGALAAFVATPCTGPFMGAALGAALVLPWPAALAVFAGLGLGLALPFLLIGFVPALRRRLPRPGAWMTTFRHILAVPMWLTAAALVWLLSRVAGSFGTGLGVALGMAAVAVLVLGGRRQGRGLAFGAPLMLALAGVTAAGMAAVTHGPARVTHDGSDPAFSEAALARLRAQHRPVFAYFTADWCLTCKVNERAAIDTGRVRDAFARHHVAVLEGDWTDGDPVLGRFIQAHNRAGVPLYLYYPPDATTPRVLPQVLTPGLLAELADNMPTS